MRQPSTYRRVAILATCFLILAACSQAGITVKGSFSRPSPTIGGTGAAFMTIVNNGRDTDRLVSAGCPVAKVVELHETTNEDGVMRMQPRPEGFEIPAGGQLELKPGGKHVMLMGLTAPLKAGDKIEITLNFERAGPVKVEVPVREP